MIYDRENVGQSGIAGGKDLLSDHRRADTVLKIEITNHWETLLGLRAVVMEFRVLEVLTATAVSD